MGDHLKSGPKLQMPKTYDLKRDLSELIKGLNDLAENLDVVIEAASIAAASIASGGRLFFCGNGGSAADSQHWAAELTGRFNYSRKAYGAIALTVDTSAITAIGNDFGFDYIFARQLEGLAHPGDVLIAITTSGNSRNVVEAAKSMSIRGGQTIAFSGPSVGEIDIFSNLVIHAKASRTDLIQDIQVFIGHSFCKVVEEILVNIEAE